MANLNLQVQAQAFTLAGSGVSIGDTTMILSSLKDLEGNNLTMTDFGDKGFMTIEPNSSDREELITFTGITQNANGTATITGISRQIGKSPYTETSGFGKTHPGGVRAVLSNTAGFYQEFLQKDNDATITQTYTFTDPKIPRMTAYSAPTDDEQLATKKYVDDTAGGSPISINRIVVSGTAGETVAAGNILYLDETDNEWKKADASASATCDNLQLGIAQGSGTNGNPISGGVLLQGRDTNQSGFAQGDRIYISDTAGTLANSAGTIEVEVGHSISATAIDFTPKFASYTTKLQRDALAGSSGTPSGSNKFLTEDDDAITATASKLVRTKADTFIGGDFLTGTVRTLNAGEVINGATLPVAIYQSTSDNEIYACDGNDQAKLDFIGFAITNGTDGNPIDIQVNGIVRGFTGLAEGTRYYIQDDKTIGTSIGTYEVLVGIAISETELLIQKGSYEYVGTDTISAVAPSGNAVDTSTMPTIARIAVLNISGTSDFVRPTSLRGEIIITRKGKTSGQIYIEERDDTSSTARTLTASLSGDTITITLTRQGAGTNFTLSGNVYYYR